MKLVAFTLVAACASSPQVKKADANPVAKLDPAKPRVVPGIPADVEEMHATSDVVATLEGAGKLRAARAFVDEESQARIGIVTEAGWQTFPVDGVSSSNEFVTLEAMKWVDIDHDGEHELWAEVSTFRDPCGCDDGPTFSSNFVVVCRVRGRGAQCSKSILVASSHHVAEEIYFHGELVIRGGFARVGIREEKNLSRSDRHRITRSRRLF